VTVTRRRAVPPQKLYAVGGPRCARAFGYYPRLKCVDRYVRDHLRDPISIREIAGVVHLEPTYFCHFFREKTGVTFRWWLAARRVELAVTMLEEQDYPVVQVAEAVGFHNYRTYERWFRRFTGMAPQEFKERVRPS